MSAAADWDAWLADSLGRLQVDSGVYGPYVTGILVRPPRWRAVQRRPTNPLSSQEDDSLSSTEQTASVVRPGTAGADHASHRAGADPCAVFQMDLLTDAAPPGAVQAATVDSFTQRWAERCRQQTLEAAAAGEAVLAQYAAAKAAQRRVRACARCGH